MTNKTTEQSAASLFQGWAEMYKKQSKGDCTPLLAAIFTGASISAELCAEEMRQRGGLTVQDKVDGKQSQFAKDMMRAVIQMTGDSASELIVTKPIKTNVSGNGQGNSG